MPIDKLTPSVVFSKTVRGLSLCVLASGPAALGQNVLAPPPPEFAPQLPPAPGISEPGTAEQGVAADTLAAGQSALEWGIAKFRPRVFYRLSYGNDLPSAPGQQEKSIIQEVSPGISIRLGEKWGIDYTPTFRFYSSDQFRDTFENRVIFAGGTTYEDWAFGFSQSFANSDQSIYQTAAQTEQDNFDTAITAIHQINSKLSLDLELDQNIQLAPQYVDSYQWSTLDYLNYRFSPELSVGVGPGYGYILMSEGFDVMFEQIMGQISWTPGPKLNLHANLGGDFRQFVDAGVPTVINPTYGLTLRYQLFESTALSLIGSKSAGASYFANEIQENTNVSLGINQRFLKKLNLWLSGGYRLTSYITATQDLSESRQDDGYFFQARLSTALFKSHATAAIFYRWEDNSSDSPGYGYTTTELGFELGYRF
jgi:hypothetical protein